MSCKTINIDLANVPPVPLRLGVAGENAFRTIAFDASTWGADFPDATYTVVYKRSDGYLYPVLVNAAADAIVWSPTDTDTAVSGNGQLEVRLLDGETIGKTIIMRTYVAPSLSGDESEPSTPAPDWVNDVADDADRAEAAVSHYPKIVNGVWFVWNAETGEFVSTGISAQGEDGVSPTVTVTEIDGGHRVTITDADGAHTFDVMDGDGGSGAADAVLYTAQSLTDSQKAQARTNVGAGTYSKPSGGIPKTDLAQAVQTSLGKADTALQTAPVTSVNTKTGAVTLTASDVNALPDSTVIPTVPAMATNPDMTDWASGKTVDAAALKTDLEMFDGVLTHIYGVLDDKADKTEIPSLTGYATETWVDGKGFQTAQDVQTAIAAAAELPTVTASDNGKVLAVNNGEWSADSPVIVSGTDAQVANAVNDYLTQYGVPLRLSEEIKQALLDCFENVAWINDDGQTYYDALYAALYNEPAPPSPVPNEYQRVEWVGSTGTLINDGGPFILTNITEPGMAQLDGYTIRMTVACGAPITGVSGVSGMFVGFSSKAGTYVSSLESGGIGIGAAASGLLPNVVCTDTNDYVLEFSSTGLTLSSGTNSVTRNYSTSGDAAQQLIIGTSFVDRNTASWLKYFGHIVVEKNGNAVGDFYPCYRKADSVIGFYDIVTETFFVNSGTGGAFTKGADIQ